ncbi:MAG: hypothetical protein EKK41_25735 [Hyphomicrobiales bacterium]|nr:MAG: hypothetical protein EKK41_25735 [Hyphomicrobiales bacterium]
MRTPAIAAALSILACGQALATESATTRIEPRPYYGAVVTIEKGVRVYRPLPAHDRVIINPSNAPVYIGVNDYPVVPGRVRR